MPVEGKANVVLTVLEFGLLAKEYLKLPLYKTISDDLSSGLKVGKLLVGVSSTESLPAPALTEKLFGVKLLPLPDSSFPSVVAVVP